MAILLSIAVTGRAERPTTKQCIELFVNVEARSAQIKNGWVRVNDGRRFMRNNHRWEQIRYYIDGRLPDSMVSQTLNQWDPRFERSYRLLRGLPDSRTSDALRSPEVRVNLLNPEQWRDKKILDVGTGDGLLVEELRSRGYEADGIDLVLNEQQLQAPYFFVGDIASPLSQGAFKSESYDVLIVAYSLFHYPHSRAFYRRAIEAMVRLLKPGGVLIIVDANSGLNELLKFTELELLTAPPATWKKFNNDVAFVKRRK